MSAPHRHWLLCPLLFAFTVLVSACRVVAPAPSPTQSQTVERPPLIASPALAARCDPSRCKTFCQAAACLFSNTRACLETCQSRCGDAFFEPADFELLECVVDSQACEGAKTCCGQHFTSHLCAE